MRPFKEYDKSYLEKVVKECSSLRGMGKIVGVSGANIKSVLLRYNIDFSHFKHGKIYEGMIGNKYHMLIVENIYKKGKKVFARCFCECGNKKDIRADDIKCGRAISCGCHSKNRWNMVGDKNPAWKGEGELSARKYWEIKRRAEKRKKEFNISIEYLWNLFLEQDRKCALTGLSIYFGRVYYRNETSASLDRIDNNKGYIKGNVRWVLKDINMIRGSYSTEYFIKLCQAVADNSRQVNF